MAVIVRNSFIESLAVVEDNNRHENDDVRNDGVKIVPCLSTQDSENILSCMSSLPTQLAEKKSQIETDSQSPFSNADASEIQVMEELEEESILYHDPNLPKGWTRSIKRRKEGRYDITIRSPDFGPHRGRTFRSANKIKAYLEEYPDLPYTSEDFNFNLTKNPEGFKTNIKRRKREVFRRKLSSSSFDRKFPKQQNIVDKPPIPTLFSHTESQLERKEQQQFGNESAPICQIIVNQTIVDQSNSHVQKILLPPIPESSPEAQAILKNYHQSISNIAVSPGILETNSMDQVILPKFVMKSSTNQPKYGQKYRNGSKKNKIKLNKETNEYNDESIDYDEPELRICELSNAKILTNNIKTYTFPPTQKRRKTVAETTTTPSILSPQISSTCGSVNHKPDKNTNNIETYTFPPTKRRKTLAETSITSSILSPRIVSKCGPVNDKPDKNTNDTETSSFPPTKRRKTVAETTTTSSIMNPRIVSTCGSVNDNTIVKLKTKLDTKTSSYQIDTESMQVAGLMQLSSEAPTKLISTMSPYRMSSTIQKLLKVCPTIQMSIKESPNEQMPSNMMDMQDNNDIIVIRPGDQMLTHEDIALEEEDAVNDGTAQAKCESNEAMKHHDVNNSECIRRLLTLLKRLQKRKLKLEQYVKIIEFCFEQVRKFNFGTSDPSQLPFLVNASGKQPIIHQLKQPVMAEVTKVENFDKSIENTNSKNLNNNGEYMAKINENMATDSGNLNTNGGNLDTNRKNLDTNAENLDNSSISVPEEDQSQEGTSGESNASSQNAQRMPKNITHRQIRDMLFSSDSESDSD